MQTSDQTRNTALQQVENTSPETIDRVESVIKEIAGQGKRFTAFEVRKVLKARGITYINANVIGAAFGRASRKGIISVAGVTNSEDKSAHSRLIREWVAA